MAIREIWYVSLGNNIGYEEDGKGEEFLRPVLVISKIGNMFFVVPMTTKGKNGSRYYHELESINFNKPSYLLLSQNKMIDKKRFVRLVKKGQIVSKIEFKVIQKKLKELCLPTL